MTLSEATRLAVAYQKVRHCRHNTDEEDDQTVWR